MLDNKISKIIIFFSIFFASFILLNTISYAAADFYVSADKQTLNTNGTATLTIKANDCLGQFTISSSDSSIVSVSENSKWLENSSASIKLTAKKAGKATIKVEATNVSDTAGDNEIKGSKSVTITVAEPTPTPTQKPTEVSSKSSDATLKSITVGGKTYTSPKTNITAQNVNSDVSSIKITAQVNDSKSKISGTGTKELATGTNTFTIKVTAENGNVQNYVVKVTRLAEEVITPNVVDDTPTATPTGEIKKLKLTSLIIDDVELIPAFNEDTFEYSAFITNKEEINIHATPNDEEAEIEVVGNKNLIDGENIVIVNVIKGEDNSQYKIIVKKTGLDSLKGNIENIEKDEENKVGIIGYITDWWDDSGLMTVALATILLLLSASIMFAIIAYRYSNKAVINSKHARSE